MHHFDRDELRKSSAVLFETPASVRFQDIDAAGIVFFARIFEYFHACYEQLLEKSGHPLPQVLAEGQWAAPIRHAEADYFSPLRFGDTLQVQIVAAHVEETEISLGFRILRGQEATVAAVGQSVHTFISPETRKRCPVPESLVASLRAS